MAASTLRKQKSTIQIARCLSGRQKNWNNGKKLDSMKSACRSYCQPRSAAAKNSPPPPSRQEPSQGTPVPGKSSRDSVLCFFGTGEGKRGWG